MALKICVSAAEPAVLYRPTLPNTTPIQPEARWSGARLGRESAMTPASNPSVGRAEAAAGGPRCRHIPSRWETGLLFLTEILGAEVIDVRQRRSGAVRDLAVRVQEPYPVVTGLVVSRRRQLAIPS